MLKVKDAWGFSPSHDTGATPSEAQETLQKSMVESTSDPKDGEKGCGTPSCKHGMVMEL